MKKQNLIARFSLAGALLGTFVGLGEGVVLHSIPRNPALLEPDVRFPILFIAPLIGLVVFGLLGVGLGALASAGNRPTPERTTILAALGLGAAAGYLADSVRLIQVWNATLRVALFQPMAWACFALVFLIAVLALRKRGILPGDFLDAGRAWPLRRFAALVALAGGLCLLSVTFYVASPAYRPRAAHADSNPPPSQPNIILITLDTVRADHLSAYGYHRRTTPNLERWANRGVLFDNAIAPTSWTLPSHASIFTGLLPHQHGANYLTPIAGGLATLARVLSARGYETAGFTANFRFGASGWGMRQGFEHYVDDSSSVRHMAARTLAGATIANTLYRRLYRNDHFSRRSAGDLNRDVRRWFEGRSSRPYFLFINYFDAHEPYFAPSPYDGQFGRLSESVLKKASRKDPEVSPETKTALAAGYDNCLAYLDEQLGRFLDYLSASPQWANTVVIITSDHGEGLGEHGTFGHATNLYREVLHVPLLISGPGVPHGMRRRDIVRLEDLYPTLLDLASQASLPFHQFSLRRYWTPGYLPGPLDGMAVSELCMAAHRPSPISLVTSEWHWIRSSDGRAELYDWRNDPFEQSNLAGSPGIEPVIESLEQKLYGYIKASVPPWRGPEYLFPLGKPGGSLLQVVFAHRLTEVSLPSELRPGSSQTYFGSSSASPARPLAIDEELMKSLPYQ